MYNDFLKYLENTREHNKQMLILMLLTPPLMFLILFSAIGCTVVLPLGIVSGIGCFFYLKFYFKKIRIAWRLMKDTRTYQKQYELSKDIKKDTTYCFIVPYSMNKTLELICDTLRTNGHIISIDHHHGIINGKFRVSPYSKRKMTFYVERNRRKCRVRAVFHNKANDDWWDLFLNILFEKNTDVDFGVTYAKGDPLVAHVLDLNGDILEEYSSVTYGGTSLSGFLMGGALFGEAGAIVGGLSGNQHTVTTASTTYSTALLVRLIYSNGRLWEGTVYKDSHFYNEIMVNLQPKS